MLVIKMELLLASKLIAPLEITLHLPGGGGA